jgi:hypothetical protein
VSYIATGFSMNGSPQEIVEAAEFPRSISVTSASVAHIGYDDQVGITTGYPTSPDEHISFILPAGVSLWANAASGLVSVITGGA